MAPLLVLLALVAVPVVELLVIIKVAHLVGAFDTVALLFLVSLVGAWLCKRQGIGALRRFQRDVQAGELPGPAVVDGLLILTGGALMVVPGFVTGAVGLLLLLPPSRRPVRALVVRRVRHRIGARLHVVETTQVIDADSWEAPARGRPQLPGGRTMPYGGHA